MRKTQYGTAAGNDGGVPTRIILTLTWALATAAWAIFTPPERTFAARVILFQPLWTLRILGRNSTWTNDLLLALVLHTVYSFWSGAWIWPGIRWLRSVDYTDDAVHVYISISALLSLCGLFAGAIVLRDHHLKNTEVPRPPYSDRRISEELLPPLLIPSRTTHTRISPKKHSFAYSYLLVGIPVGATGKLSSALSVDGSPPAWFDVRSADYLNRGDVNLSLADKLKSFLHSHGVTDRDYAFAYLITAPRFLGYSFNPVSFWYLYNSDARLKYMILEVNNTFDERRLYLLRATERQAGDAGLGSAKDVSTVFTDAWEKDFHVSPFNSRKGSYSLRAQDPLTAMQDTSHASIDNTIVLRSSKAETKLIARIFSNSPPTLVTEITSMQLAGFIVRWWWVGLVTFPRIVRQAAKLYFTHSLHVWYRPEVTPTSFGRAYTSAERDLERFFRALLSDCVTSTSEALRLVYVPPHADGAESEIVFYSPGFTYEEAHLRTLNIKVLSPAFYSRFVHYAHAKESFDRESLATDEKNRTVLVEPAHLLPVLLEALRYQSAGRRPISTSAENLRWRLLQHVRCPPPPPSYAATSPASLMTTTDIRARPISEMDRFARASCDDASAYRRICMQIFLAQRIAFGIPVLISAMDMLIRSVILLLAMQIASRTDVFDVLRPRPHSAVDWLEALGLLAAANGVHLWSMLKG